jgi:hypothetical protein
LAVSGTVISDLSGQQFADRVADLFPRGWSGDEAKYSGNLYALFLSFGQQMAVVQDQIQYAQRAQRMQTETFPELDEASQDFLGDILPRASGTTDAAFARQITAAMFQPVATRRALSNALIQLTGFQPRMMEPWNVRDTGAWGVGGPSFWNVDTIANPARWAAAQRYQGYIETTPPALAAIGPNNPILTWGTAYWNVGGYFFGIISSVGIDTLNARLNRLRAYGIEIWVKLLTQSQLQAVTGVVAPAAVLGLTSLSSGPTSVTLTWSAPSTGTPPYIYTVYYRLTGTIAYTPGPSGTDNTVTVTGLATGVSYDFTVVVRNSAGSAGSDPVAVTTGKIAPSPVQNLVATLVQATAITLAWDAPAVGSTPITYSINYRIFGTTQWQNLLVGPDTFAVTLIGLVPLTTYDLEVVASNL